MNRLINNRMAGVLLLVVVLGAGVLAGYALGRRPREGVEISIRATNALPKELRDLGLSAAQRDSLGAILLKGRQSARTVLQELEPRMRAAMDSLDLEIHAVLTPEQRTRLDASRKGKGAMVRSVDTSVVIDKTGDPAHRRSLP